MDRKKFNVWIGIVTILLVSCNFIFAQNVKINAGANQIINWDKTHSAQLKGSVTPDSIKVEWSCAQNKEVVFKNSSSLSTEVTFPRSGYFLLTLSTKGTKDVVSSSVVVNVFKPNSYKNELAIL